jgi:asparagine synthase (glutamine-hydrolysing)
MEWGEGWILGHTRLAIIDLSHRSSQPMTDGRGLWLVYNGEIYNFRELRAELAARGHTFVSQGDAEVLLHAWKEWGVGGLERLRGMFAFALLDAERRELILARDRYGVKPLAYQERGGGFRFASDLFALRALPDATTEVDPESAYLYLALGYVPAPHSIHPGVRKVRPGHYVRVRWSGGGVEEMVERPYWSPRAAAGNGGSPASNGGSPASDGGPLVGGNGDAAAEYERRASEAIGYRLISDVPVGTFLSGGIDSTLVTALGREQSPGLPAFTMGFDDPAFDERPFARPLARHLGGNHTEFEMSDGDVRDAWSRLWSVYDEPFADCSAIPTLMLSRRVVERVKVALTGDGGDEALGGYAWHRALDRLDPAGRGYAADEARVEHAARFRRHHRLPADEAIDRPALWSIIRTGLSDAMQTLLPIAEPLSHAPLSAYFRDWSRELDAAEDCIAWAGRLDLLTYLPDDLMVKADRASMSVGLELREPLLDHDLTAWCFRAPLADRFDHATGATKVMARRALERRVPRALLDRPKQGFTPPLQQWLARALAEAVPSALERLSAGDLEPLALPWGCRSWKECDPVLHDVNRDFLWRVVCFSEWNQRVRRAA